MARQFVCCRTMANSSTPIISGRWRYALDQEPVYHNCPPGKNEQVERFNRETFWKGYDTTSWTIPKNRTCTPMCLPTHIHRKTHCTTFGIVQANTPLPMALVPTPAAEDAPATTQHLLQCRQWITPLIAAARTTPKIGTLEKGF